MGELKNLDQELGRFRLRLLAAGLFVLVGFGLLTARLSYLQIVRFDELSTQAENNRITVLPIPPNRGLILDRNGVVLASNYSAYTLELTPSKIDDLDATIDALAQVVEITPRDRKRFKRLMDDAKSFESLPIRSKLSDEDVARFTAQRFRFPGVDIKARLFRNYPYGDLASHVLGYIGRINQAEKEAIDDTDDAANYKGTDYIGKLGIEQKYETELHGATGFEEVETSAAGRAVRRLRANPPTPGNTVHLSIDIKLQALVEQLFGDRRGALVALDPRNGEVLAFVSKPTFDPNLFVDGIDAESWKELNESIDRPLLNRALRGTYPPGSTYKPFMAMAALNTGKRSPSTVIMDNLSFSFGGHTFGSPETDRAGPKDMRSAIITSSNVYFYSLANEMGVDLIHDQLEPFGFGRKTGIDLDGEVTGVLPSTEWKRKAYKRKDMQKWYAGETISLGIGQGYNNFTMLQMATAVSTLASGGKRFEPRIVREIEDQNERREVSSHAIAPLELRPQDVEVIRSAMHGVTQPPGTSWRVFTNAGYDSAGKTGTAQAAALRQNEKYNASRIDEHLRDHALYVAFAPAQDPQVALAVIVENAGWGAGAAAPIARRVFDYLLRGQWPSEEDIVATRESKSTAPLGAPRLASEVTLMPNTPGVTMSADGSAGSGFLVSFPPTPAAPAASGAASAPAAPPPASAPRPAPKMAQISTGLPR